MVENAWGKPTEGFEVPWGRSIALEAPACLGKSVLETTRLFDHSVRRMFRPMGAAECHFVASSGARRGDAAPRKALERVRAALRDVPAGRSLGGPP